MTWAKFDDKYATHRKLIAAGLEATGLDTRGICYSAQQETDGFLTEPDVQLLTPGVTEKRRKELTAALVKVGRWEKTEGGFLIHDYLVFNDSHEELAAKREHERARKAKGRAGQERGTDGRLRSASRPPGQPAGSDEESGAESVAPPTGTQRADAPDRPVPSRPVQQPSSSPVSEEPPATSPLDDDDRIRQAITLVADRKVARQPNVRNLNGYLKRARENASTEHGDRARALATQHSDWLPDRIADELERGEVTVPAHPLDGTQQAQRERMERDRSCPDCHGTGWRLSDTDDGAVPCDHRALVR